MFIVPLFVGSAAMQVGDGASSMSTPTRKLIERKVRVFYENERRELSSPDKRGEEGSEDVVIRDMALKDVANCYKMGETLFNFNSSLSRTFDRFVVIEGYSSDGDFCLVAEVEGKLVGFTLGNTITKDVVMGYVSWVAVLPEYQVGSFPYSSPKYSSLHAAEGDWLQACIKGREPNAEARYHRGVGGHAPLQHGCDRVPRQVGLWITREPTVHEPIIK